MKKIFKILIVAIGFIIVIAYLFGGGIEEHAKRDLDKIKNEVALDAEKQYEIAKRSGDAMDAYIQAGLVAAAYLQANDEVNYKKWKDIETKEAKNVGL